MEIDGRKIGPGNSPYVIAEIASEHCGSLLMCKELIDTAKWVGADAAKVQLYDPERLAEARGGVDKVLPSGPWAGRTLLDLYTEAHTPRSWFPELFDYARKVGITLFSSVFHVEDVPFLEDLGCPAYKIASFEISDLDLISAVAFTRKPIIVSTGMASDVDIWQANDCITNRWTASHAPGVAFLHCVSAYPCPLEAADLQRMSMMPVSKFQVRGLSDHTLGYVAPVVATALGASIIEKHITLSRVYGGPDKDHSLTPTEFKDMVVAVKDAYASLGTGKPAEAEDIYRPLRRRVA